MKTRILAVVITMILVGGVYAADSFDSLKSSYGQGIKNIEATNTIAMKNLGNAYCDMVNKAVETLKKQGDPDPVRMGIAEMSRFDSEKTVPAIPNTNMPPVIRDIQARYNVAFRNIEVEKDRKSVQVMKQYVASLDRLMRQYTVGGKLDLAVEVKAEKAKVDALIAVADEQVKKLAVVVTTNKTSAAVVRKLAPKVPKEAKAFKGHHYLFVADSMTWHDAKKTCEDMGGHLVIITSKAEDDCVASLIGKNGAWIGCANEKKDGAWEWVDGTPVQYEGWQIASPITENGTEHYGAVWFGKQGFKWWNVKDSHPIEGYICEWEY